METPYIIGHAAGIAIIHLRAAHLDDEIIRLHSPMDYHIHIINYFDKELEHAGALCLDTGHVQTMPCTDEKHSFDAFKELDSKLARLFVDVIDSMIKNQKYDRKLLFNRVEQPIWDYFNEVKEQSFMARMPEYVEYLSARGATIRKDTTITEEPERYKWAEITPSEERRIVPGDIKLPVS